MVNLTLKDIKHERARFVLILLGLTICIILVNIGIGFLNGMMEENRRFFEHNPQYEGYVVQENRKDIFSGGEVNEEIYNKTIKIDGVKSVEKLIISGIGYKVGDEIVGTNTIGYDLTSDITPWNIIEGKEVKLFENYTIILDISAKRFIPSLEIGDKILAGEGTEVEIVGFTEGNTFWGNPLAWCSFETARLLTHAEDEFTALAIQFDEDYSARDLKHDLRNEDVSAYSSEEIVDKLNNEVVNNMGSSILPMVFVGFFVTMIIISASMYSTILEKVPQFVTFKALGANQGFINRLLLSQVLVFITLSTVFGTIISYIMSPLISNASVFPSSVSLPWVLVTYGIALNLGILSALISIRKVKKTDPAVIFRA